MRADSMGVHQPQDDGFERRVRASFLGQGLMHTLGAALMRVAPGEVEIELPWRAELAQQQGRMHAGAIASVADSACGYAAMSLMGPRAEVVSVEFKLNLLAPAVGERIVARAAVVRAGRTITVCRCDVFAAAGGEERIVATMLGTMMAVGGSGAASAG